MTTPSSTSQSDFFEPLDSMMGSSEWQSVGLQLAQAGQRRIAQLVGADVGHHRAQIAQAAVGVDQAGLFLAGFAIAHEFHGASLV